MDTKYMPAKVERRAQPRGSKGVNLSLEEVARRATEGRLDPRVRAWATHALKKCGAPTDDLEKARCLLEALRAHAPWIEDPTNAEFMPAPHLLLGPPGGPGFFAGGDCDDLVIAYLALCGSVGVENMAVVGHAYDRGRNIGHVLAAVRGKKGGPWKYADPSLASLPFGACKEFTRERILFVPGHQVACDANECLAGPGAPSPPPPEDGGAFIGLSGALAEGPGEAGDELGRYFAAVAEKIGRGEADFLEAYQGYRRIAGLLSEEAVGGPSGWTAALETEAAAARTAAQAASQALADVVARRRSIEFLGGGEDFAIQGFRTDPFWLEERGGGLPALVAPAPASEAEEPSAPALSGTLGLPVAVIAGTAERGAFATGAAIAGLSRAIDALHADVLAATQRVVTRAYAGCTTGGGPGPAACANLTRALSDARLRELDARGGVAPDAGPSALTQAGERIIFAGGVVTALWGFYQVAKELRSPRTSR